MNLLAKTSPVIMLTLNDMTLPDASSIFEQIGHSRVQYFGFKDVGLPWDQMESLAKIIRKAGKKLFFEIVSPSVEQTIEGAERALRLEADYLVGGKFVSDVLPIVKDHPIKYFPYVGTIVGHPCNLEGSAAEILAEARKYQKMGVDGINLLAYRHCGDANLLIQTLKENCDLPLMVAGSVNSKQQITFLRGKGVELFTMGSALFEKDLVPQASLQEQVKALECFSELNITE